MPALDHSPTNLFLAEGSFDLSQAVTELRLPDGRTFHIPTAMLSESVTSPSLDEDTHNTSNATLVIPIVEESLDVSKRMVATGKVRLEKTVQSHDVTLDEALKVSTWEVKRIAVNLPVDVAPGVRQEGNTTIYPLLEEQLILTKQLVLKEEIRVTRNDSERRDRQTVALRWEQLTVERETLR